MSYIFGIEPRPPEWPRKVIYECPDCEYYKRPCRHPCGNGTREVNDYGPTMSGAWTGGRISTLLAALGLPCEEFPCSWSIIDFRAAFKTSGAEARRHLAYDPIRRWLVGVDALTLAPGTRVYVA